MPDTLSDLLPQRAPTTERPLLGVTLLLVEDSRFACEAIRLMCLRSGARLRRADCLRSAQRHLQCYRPNVVIVDLGLPDGSGLDLIDALTRQSPRVPAIIATSGDANAEAAALATGADRFLAKPVDSLAAFQDMILALMPDQPRATTAAEEPGFSPDRLALRDDLTRAAALLRPEAEADIDYVARFLSGLALSAHDPDLRIAADALLRDRAKGPLRRVSGLVQDRLAANAGF
jgi:CheY-like chemotaxis protein